ncbi:hypothetical protein [Nostoc sp. DSM 114167]|jgi:cell division protein ZapA (FtsZ GTPase activity inhibitor)|uniref:hypothetical protein n=1 Tax=Nostoc sp. DSM 114167 TaxID=3439050 RepID=UPI004045C547
MTKKHRISAKAVDTRLASVYALDELIDCIRTLDPDLDISEATLLTAITLHSLQDLLKEIPSLKSKLQEAAAEIKRKRSNPQQPITNERTTT